jgi:hypothetical protein
VALAQRRRWGRRLGAAEPLQELEARVSTQDGLPQGGRQLAGGQPQGGPLEQPAALAPADPDTQAGVPLITH